jgi:hypothetical protein
MRMIIGRSLTPLKFSGRWGAALKRATVLAPTLFRDLDALVEPTAPGDPESPLRWTCLSTRTLAEALGHRVSHTVVAELLHELRYSRQGNVKTREGRQHPDRDARFPTLRSATPGIRGTHAAWR